MGHLSFNDYCEMHHEDCLHYGIDPLTTNELLDCYDNDLNIEIAYMLASDLYCEAHDTFDDALSDYVVKTM